MALGISICSREKRMLTSTSFTQSADIPDELPGYVRFDTIDIEQSSNYRDSNEEWCEIYSDLLHKLHPAFVRSSLKFKCYVRFDRASFPNGSTLLSYISETLLPIFAHCRSYKFVIGLFSSSEEEDESERNFITSLLKLSPIKSCPSVKIRVVPSHKPAMIQPEAISDFFQSGGDQLFQTIKSEKFLKIACDIHNFSEIVDHLKQVIKLRVKYFSFFYWIFVVKSYEALLKIKKWKKQDPKIFLIKTELIIKNW